MRIPTTYEMTLETILAGSTLALVPLEQDARHDYFPEMRLDPAMLELSPREAASR